MLIAVLTMLACGQRKGSTVDWFTGKDLALQQAIDADDAAKLHAAVAVGASVNAKGKVDVTPLEYAVGHFRKQTFMELLRMGANPNQRDKEQDNAVTLAARAFEKDPDYLRAAIKAGGDPNTLGPDEDPILGDFIANHNNEGIKTLSKLGADINIKGRDGDPFVVSAAFSQDWDAVWCLLELGAKYDYTTFHSQIQAGFRNYKVVPPGSPLWKYKQQSWEFLKARGVDLPPLQ